ncbi:AAA family ATPase, partial [Mycobacteroides abscessus]
MTLYLVTGPPAAGKSTWVRQHAKHGDITIDYDAIASVLTPAGGDPHDP